MKVMLSNETPEDRKKRQTKNAKNMEKARKNSSELKRLKNFREAVRYGPIFTCTVCDQDMFRHSVTVLTEKLKEELTACSSELCKEVLINQNQSYHLETLADLYQVHFVLSNFHIF